MSLILCCVLDIVHISSKYTHFDILKNKKNYILKAIQIHTKQSLTF